MPVIDLHCDTADRLFNEKSNLLMNDYHIDLNKLKKGNYLAQWFALFIDTESVKRPLMASVRAMYDYLMAQISLHSEDIVFTASYDAYMKAKSMGKIAAFLSIEEGQVIEGQLDNIQKLSDLGIRMMTLTWNYDNDLGASHSSTKGLTRFGKEAAAYLNNTPILADISHLSEAAVKELAGIYKKPIIASHCNARGIYSHTRNLSDDTIHTVADSGGIIGINFYGLFLDGSEKSSLKALTEHIHHIYKIGGEDVIALGTDFDGMNCELEVCNAGEMGKLIDVLVQLYPQSFIDKLTYKNAERIIRENL